MNSFQNALTSVEQEMVYSSVELRFKNPEDFVTPEALIIHEQGLIDDNHLFELVKQEYINQGFTKSLEIPKQVYLPNEIVEHFRDKACIPLSYDNVSNIIHVAVLPEKEELNIEKWNDTKIERHLVPIYYYVDKYIRLYNSPEFLLELPVYDLLNYIVYKAIKLGASDITLSSGANEASLYYSVKKVKVTAGRRINKREAAGICEFLQCKAGVKVSDKYSKPVFFSVELNRHYRARISMTFTYQGILTAIRIIENDMPIRGLDALNISKSATAFIREIFISDEPGLRLLIGPAASGKNTTITAALYEKLFMKDKKAVSLELPVEYKVDFMEQIECLSDEDFSMGAAALLRQNPDIVYIADMFDTTAKAAINAGKAGKIVYAALNANSIADSVLCLQDMTGLPLERVVTGIQSVVFQEMVIDRDMFRPENRCLYFSKKFKDFLLGVSQEAMLSAIRKEEEKWA